MNAERDFFDRGRAVGYMNVSTQTARWRFRDEEYETSAVVFWSIKEPEYRFPVASIDAVRAHGVRV